MRSPFNLHLRPGVTATVALYLTKVNLTSKIVFDSYILPCKY